MPVLSIQPFLVAQTRSDVAGAPAWPWLAALVLVICPAAIQAQTAPGPVVGEVEQLRGAGFAQTGGQLPRVLGKGLPLSEGDRLTTADNAVAIIKLKDGTKMTLRPNTELVLSQFVYADNSTNSTNNTNAMMLQLLRGGLRALTGLITKSSPNAARIQTSTATIGIRGTDFDARICSAGECTSPPAAAARPSAIAASARILQQQGLIAAVNEQGLRRALYSGASIYPGETIETASNASALLAFRDDSKINLGSSTRFRVDDFSFNSAEPASSRYFMTLLKGSMRAITGLIGKNNRQNVRFSTTTATIGIRGSEVAVNCIGPCAGEPPTGTAASGLTVFAFAGVISVNLTEASPTAVPAIEAPAFELVAGRGILVSGQRDASGVLLANPLSLPTGQEFPASPEGVPIPPDLFSQTELAEGADGLYVFVREGHVTVATSFGAIDIGRNEAGFAGPALAVVRLLNIPGHIAGDDVPLPTAGNINISGLRPQRNIDQICAR